MRNNMIIKLVTKCGCSKLVDININQLLPEIHIPIISINESTNICRRIFKLSKISYADIPTAIYCEDREE